MGKGLGIAALIFGLIGAGLGGYVFVTNTLFPPTGVVESPSIQDTSFIYYTNALTLGNSIYDYLDPISLIISVNSNESVYILFTCYVRINSPATEVYLSIYIDGTSEIYFIITRTSIGLERIPVSIQYGDSTISSGTRNVSVWGYADNVGQFCYRSALLVQTYK
jgi:hypothetical protein